jgi:ribonucleotide reductase beta subunit family protein with ferritin-like domain
MNNNELLTRENPDRFVPFPIQYNDMWSLYQTHFRAIWNESEIDVSSDYKDWEKLNEGEKHFIKNVLAFFAASDGIVLENLALRFYNDVQIPEARLFYGFQMMMEGVHSLTYALLLNSYITDTAEKNNLFRAIYTIPSIKQKAEWAQKWIKSTDSFAERLVAFACVEGIFFSGAFCCIYWIKERGILKGLCQSNDLIARDEGLHCDFAVLLYSKYIGKKLTDQRIYSIVEDAVKIEESFITDSIPCRLLGMNADMMKEYIKFIANRLVKQLGHSPLYPDAKQPFAFMDRICFGIKSNFFEKETTQYQTRVETLEGNTNDDLNFNAYF